MNNYNFNGAKKVNNEDEFKKETINLALDELKNKGIINEEEKAKLLELYLKDKRDIKDVFYEIKALTKEDVEKKLMKQTALEKPAENKISIDNVDDFENQMKTKYYIKIHYPYPSDEVKVVENYSGKTAKELFEAVKDEDGLVSVNGFVSSTDVSKEYVEPDRKEVKLHNVTDLAKNGEFSKLSSKEKECVIGLINAIINDLAKTDEDREKLKKMPIDELVLKLNRNVFIAPEENIVILCIENEPTKDEIMAVTKNAQGEYELENLKVNDDKEYDSNVTSNEETKDEEENSLEKDGSQMKMIPPWKKHQRKEEDAA